jgi:O-antigen/teichoic acid export membrane protein
MLLGAAYRRMIEVAALGMFPVFFGLSAVAPLATPLIFGEQWAPSAPLLQALSLIAIASAPYPFFVPMMLATGHTSRLGLQGVIHLGICVLFTVFAAPFGVLMVAYGQVARSSVMTIIALRTMRETAQIPFSATWEAMRAALLASFVMAVVVCYALAVSVKDSAGGWLLLVSLIGVGALVYVSTLLLVFNRETVDVWRRFRGVFAR